MHVLFTPLFVRESEGGQLLSPPLHNNQLRSLCNLEIVTGKVTQWRADQHNLPA